MRGDRTMKKLLVLGGTQISCEIVKQAQKMGIFVGVTDYNPVEKSPGKRIADVAYDISCTDVDAVVKLVKNEGYDGVITGFNDMLLPFYAEICGRAGKTCYGSKEQFELFKNKRAYKRLLKEYDVPVIDDYTDEVKAGNIEALTFPIVVKPSDNSGSRGVKICRNKDELRTAYRSAQMKSADGEVVVERYMDGREATVFWMFLDGEYYMTGIGNRHVNGFQDGCIPLPVGYTFPSVLTDRYIAKVVPKAKEMFKSIGIQSGMMFMQCKVEEGNCYVYDIGYRLTGSLEYKLFEKCCGYNPLEMMIDFAVCENTLTGAGNAKKSQRRDLKVDPYFNGLNPYNVSILARPGKIKNIQGIEEVKRMNGIIDVVVEHNVDEEITSDMRGLLSQISVRVLGTTKFREELISTMQRIEDTIRIISYQDECLSFGRMSDEDIKMVRV